MSSLPLDTFDLDPTKPNLNARDLNANLLHTDTSLQKRYTTISIPSTYGRLQTSPAAGTVVGIILGSVAGFVLLMYVLFLAVNPGGIARGGVAAPTSSSISMSMSMDEEEVVEVRKRRGSSAGRRRRDIIEVEEREGFRDSYRRRPTSRHDRVVVEESLATSTTGEDVIEVEEEESSVPSDISPRPPRRSRRSGIRHVDPMAYGGGSDYSNHR
ncbi:hypothetical protein DTO013E5_3304 [Penicillium roqueforti]|uniref:Genomic scaffold, ProqFM164S03 n=1 Tax=Penicillium roqueforti (strain FM164) TaxID=1365484 RepID=W6QZ31_PENRF|nr:uncharacterized protein LCP9604111_5928 [Penicillium roqueforti]CDM34782.1 unnamed protein product [Penicillium roqueforti FM164]KAF9247738.1 hypothetical protein LCP9604111_5928 [Penicillium roqueforti]KAI1837069.1 hypothetical protein CBS147337_2321 [Penicillium roqueforti]KAI2678125.1 hypothetical protein CBS147355_5126 [Penicillium roqueforti]KAI2686526.1 hypothetical protein LCP963914a_4126 [Penicillium roqueforti]